MPSEPAGPVQVEYTPEFKRSLRVLAKKYRHIRSDIQPVIDQLRADEVIGDQVPRTRYTIFKVRVRNSDIQKGKFPVTTQVPKLLSRDFTMQELPETWGIL